MWSRLYTAKSKILLGLGGKVLRIVAWENVRMYEDEVELETMELGNSATGCDA